MQPCCSVDKGAPPCGVEGQVQVLRLGSGAQLGVGAGVGWGKVGVGAGGRCTGRGATTNAVTPSTIKGHPLDCGCT